MEKAAPVIMQIPVEGGFSPTEHPQPSQAVSPIDEADAERIRHETISRHPSALAEHDDQRIARMSAHLWEMTTKYCQQQQALAEQKTREMDELWKKQLSDHSTVMLAMAAIEDSAYQSARDAIEVKKTIFQMLRTPVQPAPTGGELALQGFKHLTKEIRKVVSKDPRLLGGLLKMLDSGDAESSDAKSETNAASPDAAPAKADTESSKQPSSPSTIGALSPKQLIEAANSLPDEILQGRNPADMSLETLVELVTGYATRVA